MSYWRRTRFTWAATVLVAILFVAWTVMVTSGADPTDGWWSRPTPGTETYPGQIASTLTLVMSPPVIMALLLIAAWWAKDRRLHAIAGGIVLSIVLTWSSVIVVKYVVDRPRPDTEWDFLVTYSGPSYPSEHAAVVTAAAILMVALTTTTRHSLATVLVWRAAGVVAVVAVGFVMVFLHAHHLGDVIGGVLLGGLATSLSMLICDIHILSGVPDEDTKGRAAIVYNPSKIPDPTTFMRLVDNAAKEYGWEGPIWLATTPGDPGHSMARAAREAEADLVMIAGGDGTVRVVLGELAYSGIRVAIVPAGTGNLLARNLDIPLDYARALELLGGDAMAQKLDLLRFTSPEADAPPEYSAVMAGVGADAAIFHDTNENLKRQIGSLAYITAGLNNIRAVPMKGSLQLDDGEAQEIEASLVSIGNVSDLTGGITFIPDASSSDGQLDVLVASPRNAAEITQMVGAVLTDPRNVPHLTHDTARKVTLRLAEPSLFQIDGDVIGEVTELHGEVLEHAVEVLVPKR